MKQSTSKWFSVLEKMPERNEVVLMYVPFCRHKVETGMFNGLEWKTIIGLKIFNVCFWSKIIQENLPEFNRNILEENEKTIKENYSLSKSIAIDFEEWIGSPECKFEYVSKNQWLYEGDYFETSQVFDYYERLNIK